MHHLTLAQMSSLHAFLKLLLHCMLLMKQCVDKVALLLINYFIAIFSFHATYILRHCRYMYENTYRLCFSLSLWVGIFFSSYASHDNSGTERLPLHRIVSLNTLLIFKVEATHCATYERTDITAEKPTDPDPHLIYSCPTGKCMQLCIFRA